MAQLAGVLEIQMRADLARISNDMNDAKRIVGGAMGSIEKAVGTATAALGALGIGLSAGYFVSLIKGSIDAADAMNDLSQRVGIGVKELAKYELAAKQSGTSMESVAKGMKGLAVNMVEHGNALKKVGITATDTDGALLQLAAVFEGMPDGMEKSALAAKLFGKAGIDLIPMLNLGKQGLAEAAEKSAKYAAAMAVLAPEADKFNDAMAEISIASKVMALSVANTAMPALLQISGAMALAAQESGGLKAVWIGFGGLAAQVWNPLSAVMRQVGASAHEMAADINLALSTMTTGDVRLNFVKTATSELAAAQRIYKEMTALGDGLGLDKSGKPAVIPPPKLDTSEWKKQFAEIMKALGGSDVKAGKKSNGVFGPMWDAADHATYIASQKAIADAIESSNKALAEQDARLGNQVAAANRALETYGLTEVQILDLTLARLQENKAREEARDADAATLAYYEKEITALKQIREAKAGVEAKETAKKAAEDAAKSWENFTRDLESSLTDALMRSFEAGDSFGEAFADNLKNIFKTMLLKAAVQITVGTVAGSAQQALGINVGGAGSGGSSISSIGNLLSTGQSLYGAFTGATASGIGGLIGGSFGAGMQGASLAAGLAGPTTAGASGAMGAGAMAASAIPWVAGALAIASIFGSKLFGSKSPAPVEWGLRDTPLAGYNLGGGWDPYGVQGPFTRVTTLGQHLSRNGLSVGTLKSSVTDPLVELDKVLAQYLSGGEISKVAVALMLGNEGEHGWSQAAVEGVMMRRLNRISDAIGGWADKLFDTTTGDIQKRYQELAQILSVRGNAETEQLAQDMFNATGQWSFEKFSALQASISNFKSLFSTDTDRLADYTAAMSKAFQSLNVALPQSRDGFKSLVEGIDTSTKSGFDLYATLLELSPTMDAYYNALSQELSVKKQLAAMSESGFATAVDYRRYQGVAANYDATLAGDYAYNIRMGAIKPGAAANGDIVSELRALRTEQQAQSLAIAANTQDTARILRRWQGDGMPETRVVA